MGFLISKWFSSFSVTRVSSAAIKSTAWRVSTARGEKSDRFPIGVPTTYRVPLIVSSLSDIRRSFLGWEFRRGAGPRTKALL